MVRPNDFWELIVVKLLSVIALTAFALSACTSTPPAAKPAPPDVAQTRLPVPVLKVGQPASIDLIGNGQATVTIATTELSKLDDGSDRLVVTVEILLNKAGKPITGGPENFRFRDKDAVLHKAQVDGAQPLASVSFTTSGQTTQGRLYFDVPAGSAAGGHIQLMTGALVHAVWSV
jgi:hypothetical protein